MASRETIGSTIRMQLINLPTQEEEPRPTGNYQTSFALLNHQPFMGVIL